MSCTVAADELLARGALGEIVDEGRLVVHPGAEQRGHEGVVVGALCTHGGFRLQNVVDAANGSKGSNFTGDDAWRWRAANRGIRGGLHSSSSARSCFDSFHLPAATLARTCSGCVAPAMTEATAGWPASQDERQVEERVVRARRRRR